MARKSKIKSVVKNNVPMILPSDNKIMEAYIKRNKTRLTEKALSSIEYAIHNNLSHVEVFNFHNSDFIITISEQDYLHNVNHIYKFYLETEQYELCPRVIELQKLLKNVNDEKKIEINGE